MAQGYYQLGIEEINPYVGQQLEGTIFLLGSPGSGKTRFMKRITQETGGKFVLESGIFDFFQRHVIEYVERKIRQGQTRITDFFVRDDSARGGYLADPDFKMPEIDGLNIWCCLMSAIPLDKTLDEVAEDNPFTRGKGQDAVCRNLPYSGWGAYHYREALGDRIRSGGKSGYPDWLFLPREEGKYVQIISFPGHQRVEEFRQNQSIPKIPQPDSIVYLVDPFIDKFSINPKCDSVESEPLKRCHIHLADALGLEKTGIPVHWFLSKTNPKKSGELNDNRARAVKIYSSYEERDLSEIARRVPSLDGFDSVDSLKKDLLRILDVAFGKG